jgi:histidine phosphotransfer protein HptB
MSSGDFKALGDGVENESESALCKKTLQGLRELSSDMGTSFFPGLLETFEHDAAEHLAALRLAITGGETGRLREEAHALRGSSLTIGAHRMADICQQLERLETSQSLVGALEGLARLDREFGRVKDEIKQERTLLL